MEIYFIRVILLLNILISQSNKQTHSAYSSKTEEIKIQSCCGKQVSCQQILGLFFLSLGGCLVHIYYDFFAPLCTTDQFGLLAPQVWILDRGILLPLLIFFPRHVLACWQSMDGCPGFWYLFLIQSAGAGVRASWESFGWCPTQQGCERGHPWKSVVRNVMVPSIDY